MHKNYNQQSSKNQQNSGGADADQGQAGDFVADST